MCQSEHLVLRQIISFVQLRVLVDLLNHQEPSVHNLSLIFSMEWKHIYFEH